MFSKPDYGKPVQNIEVEISAKFDLTPIRDVISDKIENMEFYSRAYGEAEKMKELTETDRGYFLKGFAEDLPVVKAKLVIDEHHNLSNLINFDIIMPVVACLRHTHFCCIAGYESTYVEVDFEDGRLFKIFKEGEGLYSNMSRRERRAFESIGLIG